MQLYLHKPKLTILYLSCNIEEWLPNRITFHKKQKKNQFQAVDFTLNIFAQDVKLFMKKPVRALSWTTFIEVLGKNLQT
jgi:hypothetical protein